jgi:hypothetical protein
MNVIVVTPSGRKKSLKILLENLKKNKEHFSEWHLWVNTEVTEDREYINELVLKYNWIKAITRPTHDKKAWNDIYQFWKYYKDPETIYIRLDDDIIYLEKDFIKKFADFTSSNPQFIITYGNIVNNGLIAHIHQRINAIKYPYHLTYTPFNELYYGTPDQKYAAHEVAESIHREFLENFHNNDIAKYYFPQWNLDWHIDGQRVFINAVGWLGKNFKEHNVDVQPDEELYITQILPQAVKMPSAICGSALCVHYAFWTQRHNCQGLDLTNILDEYIKIQHL